MVLFPFLSYFFGSEISKVMAHQWAFFNTLHSLFFFFFLWYQIFLFPLYFLGLGGGLSWGNCPLNFKWHYRKTQKGDGLCCAPCWMLSRHLCPCPPVCSEAVSEIWVCPSLWLVMGLVNLLCTFFLFLLSFLWRHRAGAVSLWMF